MALPPTIPTSFVPRSTSVAARQLRTNFTGTFGFFAYIIFGIILVLTLSIFSMIEFSPERLRREMRHCTRALKGD